MLNCSISKWSDYEKSWFEELLVDTNHIKEPKRKQWEYMSLVQALKERDLLKAERKGLAFGVGKEWTVSYFASKGCQVTATDMFPDNIKVGNWNTSDQWCEEVEDLYFKNFVGEDDFKELVDFKNVDMNYIPTDLRGYDFCWSLCALEHLGSSENGINFILNSVECLNPGGWAFHTTEFDIDPDSPKYETQDNVFYKEDDIKDLQERVNSRGWYMEPIDLSLGSHANDYPVMYNEEDRHLKIYSGDNNLVTSVRLIIQKGNK
jgi:hypothetical protein